MHTRRLVGRTSSIVWFVAVAGLCAAQAPPSAPIPGSALEQGFKTPPDEAKPRVWWHWMNGNITKEGIKLDLEWMHRVGIGGFQNFDASLFPDQVVEKRLVYMTPEWKDAFQYATALADQLGLEEAIAGSPGWSESGGPWVQPAQAMKKLVWSETRVQGGTPFSGTLAKPPTVSGPFQNVPLFNWVAAMSGQTVKPPPEYYKDSVVVAYRVPSGDVPLASLKPTITSSGGTIDAALLWDGDLVKSSALPKAPVGEKAWIQIAFAQPQAIRSVSLALAGFVFPFGPPPPGPDLEASDDGQSFRKIVNIPRSTAKQNTVSFAPVRARFFRVTFLTLPPGPSGLGDIDIPLPPPPKEHEIAELVLHTGARVNRFEEKAAFVPLAGLSDLPTPEVTAGDALAKGDIVDLTSKMRPDGALDWTPPPGEWVVLRMGYSLLGITNHPASPEGTGLEVDKLNPEHVRSYMTAYLDQYSSAVGPLMGSRGLRFLISDSWEAGAQNWTDDMIAEFTKRRGYDPRPWLPALTGRVAENAAASDRFLWDFRRTLSDMLAEYHYDQITAILKARGMGHYGESHESGRAFIGDGMEVKRTNDVPMSAMWTQRPGVNEDQPGSNADIRESASVAHIYGQNLVAAESLTAGSAPWAWSPATLKPTADKELAMGLNRFVLHTSVHQPLVDKGPGLSLGPFGQWFTRNETWAEQATPWIQYLARSSFLLQQGRFVADIAYFYGEDTNVTALFQQKAPPIPDGYNFDYVNADALMHRFSVSGGRLATASGMQYRVLALDPHSRSMSLPVLRKISDLVNAGAVVVGQKPIASPSLSDNDAEFRRVVDELWGGSGAGEHRHGAGTVYGDAAIEAVLSRLQVPPDFAYTKPKADTTALFVHRTLPDGDLYFVNNRQDRDEDLEATFRVSGREAEIWHADTGMRQPAPYRIASDRTTVPLHLDPWGAVFVVFRKPAAAPSRTIPAPVERSIATIAGPWTVRFQTERGAPDTITLDTLKSWSENADPGVKYFSGSATYSKTVDAPAGWFVAGARLWIDLGEVKELAEVSVNGMALGIVWKRPFRVDATGALKAGANVLEVKVANLWVNRMIGDRQPNAPKQYTFTRPVFYKADSPLLPSGLLGSVRVVQMVADGIGSASSR
jgi:hypothetical protein